MERLSGLLRLVSVLACLTAAASLGLFALNQTNGASARQQAQLSGAPSAGSVSVPAAASSPQRTLDELTGYLARPFAGLSSSSDQWTLRTTQTLLIWALYGAGLGYLARFIRVRA